MLQMRKTYCSLLGMLLSKGSVCTVNRWRLNSWPGQLSSLGIWGAIALVPSVTMAQIVPDSTQGAESSTVTPNIQINGQMSDRIDGGALRGVNLFHSFQEFNVPELRGLYLTNPTGIENILMRVTGNNPSNIFGTLGVLGNADLFLLNPNGILFGPNASLNLNGSFLATTADEFLFNNGIAWGVTDPSAPPLLEINVPIGLQFGPTPGTIEVQGRGNNLAFNNQTFSTLRDRRPLGLEVPMNKNLTMIGGELLFTGGNVTAPGGRIDIGSVAGGSGVTLTPDRRGWEVSYENATGFQDITLSQAASIDASDAALSGDILIQGRQIRVLEDSAILSDILGETDGAMLTIRASEFLELIPDNTNDRFSSVILSNVETNATGNGGELLVETRRLRIADGAWISASTFGPGNAGQLTVLAESVELTGRSPDDNFVSSLFSTVGTEATGNSGNVVLQGTRENGPMEQLRVLGGANISASTFGPGNAGTIHINANDIDVIGVSANGTSSRITAQVRAGSGGNGGDIFIQTEQLEVSDRGLITVETVEPGDGGLLRVRASEISIDGGTLNSRTDRQGGKGGDLTVESDRLTVSNGGTITAESSSSRKGGNITLIVNGVIELRGISENNEPSRISTTTSSNAKGGNLRIETSRLIIRDGSQVDANSAREGEGGFIRIQASESVELGGNQEISQENEDNNNFIRGQNDLFFPSSISARAAQSGRAGEVKITTGRVLLEDGAQIVVNSTDRAVAGSLEIDASSIELSESARISGDGAAGQGDIKLNTSDLILRRNSGISTNSAGAEAGGNITIDTENLVALENSDITANARNSAGGVIRITNKGTFGTQFRTMSTLESDITATGSSPDLSGSVELESENTDPSAGLVELPTKVVDVAGLIDQDPCLDSSNNSFVNIGRGGLPPDPSQPLSSRRVLVDLGNLFVGFDESALSEPAELNVEGSPHQIIEAQGVLIANDGKVLLTAETPIDSNAQDLFKQGKKLYQAGEFLEAVEVWQQAAAIFSQGNDAVNQGIIYSNLSTAYQQLSQWDRATEALHKSQQWLKNSLQANHPQYATVLAQLLNTQATLDFSLGKEIKALETWQEAANLYAKMGDKTGTLRSQINQGQALQVLGLNSLAKRLLETLYPEIQASSEPEIQATGLRIFGDSLRLVGEFEESEKVLKQSLKIAEEIKSRPAINATLLSLGNTARDAFESRKNKTALTLYQQAAIASPEGRGERPYSLETISLEAKLNQFSILVAQKRLLAARKLVPELQKEIRQIPPSRKSFYAILNFAHSLQDLQEKSNSNVVNFAEISEQIIEAIGNARELQDRPSEAYALGYLGRLYEQDEQWLVAEELTEQALLIAQEIKASEMLYLWQWQLGRVLKAKGETQKAIAAYEEAVKTLKFLRADLAATSAGVQLNFHETIEPIYLELIGLLLPPNAEVSQANLQEARNLISSLQLAELDNFFQDSCLTTQPVELDRVDTEAAVFSTITLSDRLEIIVALPGQPLRHITAPVSQKELSRTLQILRSNLINPWGSNSLESAEKLYNWMIRPIAGELAKSNIKTLVFVLDGELRNIPMSVLHDGSDYLIQNYSISVVPSLELVDPKPLSLEQLEIFVAGISLARQGFIALPNVEVELEGIQSQVSTQVMLNQSFTESNFQQTVDSTSFSLPVLHIATHGQFSSNAKDTFILTWDDRINADELETLLSRRDRENSDAIELLVLSACQTAEGDKRAALGLAGFAVRAGARSTIGSLWSVSDEATAVLMSRFYQELANPTVQKSEALRRAQEALLSDPNYQHPFFWAPYILVGNWL